MTSQCQISKNQPLIVHSRCDKFRRNSLRHNEFRGIVCAACTEMQSSPAKHMVDDTRDECG